MTTITQLPICAQRMSLPRSTRQTFEGHRYELATAASLIEFFFKRIGNQIVNGVQFEIRIRSILSQIFFFDEIMIALCQFDSDESWFDQNID